jgi:hypothetical protein
VRPAAVDDAYAALAWTAERVAVLWGRLRPSSSAGRSADDGPTGQRRGLAGGSILAWTTSSL